MFLSGMQDHASREFHKTNKYEPLREKLNLMENECKLSFSADEFKYIESWIDALMEVYCEESNFLYEQAYRDCVSILKRLKVIG